jgi:hypothetical protein
LCGKGVLNERNAHKQNLDAHLSLPRIWKAGLMLTFVKTCDWLLMSFILKLSHVFRHLCSTRLLQFISDADKFVPDGLQECPQMYTSWRSERNSYWLVKLKKWKEEEERSERNSYWLVKLKKWKKQLLIG